MTVYVNPAPVCLLSCLHSVTDSHTKHYLRVLNRHGFSVCTIRPGKLDSELEAIGLLHAELPEIHYHFWPEGTPVLEIFKALVQRVRNVWKAGWALFAVRPKIVMCMEPDSLLLAILTKPLLRHAIVSPLFVEDALVGEQGALR